MILLTNIEEGLFLRWFCALTRPNCRKLPHLAAPSTTSHHHPREKASGRDTLDMTTAETPRLLSGAPAMLSIDLKQIRRLHDDDALELRPGSAESDTTALISDDEAPTPEKGPATPEDAGTPKTVPRGTKIAWTVEEDVKLLEVVQRHGPTNWSKISTELLQMGVERVGKQCRERWHNHLSPDLKKEGFSAEEDRLIMDAVATHGTKWSDIVKMIPGRTDNAVKNRWNSSVRRLVRMQARCEGRMLPGLGDAILSAMDAQAIAKLLLERGVPSAVEGPVRTPATKRRAPLKEANGDKCDEAAEWRAAKKPRSGGGRRPRRQELAAGLELLRAATLTEAPEASSSYLDALALVAVSSDVEHETSGLDALALFACSSDSSAPDACTANRSSCELAAAMALIAH